MSLNWQLPKPTERYYLENEDGTYRLRKETERLIWGTMYVDLGTIEDKNVDEWIWRATFCARIDKPLAYLVSDEANTRRPWIPDAGLLREHIGMRTNVPTQERRVFLKRWQDYFIRETNWAARQDPDVA